MKSYRQSSQPPAWEMPAAASQDRRAGNRKLTDSAPRHREESVRAVGLPIDTVGEERRESKRQLKRERSSKPRCSCGKVAVVVKSSLTDGTTAWCLRCLEAHRQPPARAQQQDDRPVEWVDRPEALRKLELARMFEEAPGAGWKKGNPKSDSIERSR